ncbi:hypothetical protein A2U01_0010724 [Trifolium medium]|uniref:Uncharacterized protein n=1 Tax=Trifolium medium TaxID=97028 RepID=A0A392MRE8_9FABA|nr:hypothetical protein [Trifolium medium]
MHNPMMNRTRPCMTAVDGSSGNPNNRIAARGTAEPELICDNIILPEFGNLCDKLSPIHPPSRPPNETATINSDQSNAVVMWEKPISSNQRVANDNADHGNDPETP